MSSLTPGKSVHVKALSFVGVLFIFLVFGLGLWADTPEPKPDRGVRVVSFRPQGETSPAVNITITFSNSLVPEDSLNRPATMIPVKISPDVGGLARWTATDVLTIYPGRSLDPATDYRVSVPAGGDYVNGNAIGRNEEFRFHTPPLSVKIVRYQAQRTRENNRRARLVFDLDFNYPVSRERLRKVLRIAGRKDAFESDLQVVWPDTAIDGSPMPDQTNQIRLATEPFTLRDGEQQYQLIIKKDLRCVDCGSDLAVDYSYNMAVPRNPTLDLRITEVRAERAGKQGTIVLQFSSQVPTGEVRDHVKIDPAVPFSVEADWRGVRLRGDFNPATTYTVSVASGLVSANGELMERDFSSRVLMGDLRPAVRFTSQGLYMPREGSKLLEVSTVNLDSLLVEVSQVFSNNLVPYMASGADRRGRLMGAGDAYGRSTFAKFFPLESRKNEELISTIDLGAIVGDTLRGVFLVAVRGSSSRWVYDSRQVMITDIGAMARMSDQNLMVWTNSLSETKPIGKAVVKLYSRNNQVLLEGRTNSKGVASFSDIADQLKGFQPFLITVEKDGDLSYLRLDNSRLSTSDFDVSGRPYLTDGYEAFVYMDRGVFRPGETAHLVSVVRGKNGSLPENFPYRLKIVDPRGRTFREHRLTAGHSMGSISIELPAEAATGKYRATALLTDDYILGQAEFQVEEFVPDRIKVQVKTDRLDYFGGDSIAIDVSGQMLYGAPAAGLKVSAQIVLTPEAFGPEGYDKYSFAVSGNEASIKQVSLGESRLSDSGMTTFRHVVGDDHRPPGRVSAQVFATVFEAGGRTVSAFAEAKVYPYPRFVGIRTNVNGYARTGEPIGADIVVLGVDGATATSDSIYVTFSRLIFNSILKREPDGSYRYVSERSEEPIDSLWVKVGPDGTPVTFTPFEYGRYRIVAKDAIGGHAAAAEFFASGWGRVPWSMEAPDRLQLDLDQAEYVPGSIAKLQVRAPFGGRLLVTLESQTVLDHMVLDLPENTAEIELPVRREYAPNIYISATLLRPAPAIGKGMPARAYGLVPLKVRADDRRLDVHLTSPHEIRPNTDLLLDVLTTGSDRAQVTIAAVDIGVLQLTNFRTPDPFQFFCGKRRPALVGYDPYSLIYPETQRAGSHLSPPGGANGDLEMKHLNPFQARRINVVSLWSGVLAADSTGRARVTLPVPQFNGRLQIMAVAIDGDRFGSGSASTLVREPIILQESFPRFIAPDDEVQGLVTVFNGLDSAATISVSAMLTGQARLSTTEPRHIRLESGEQGTVEFHFVGSSAPGVVGVELQARAGTEESRVSFELSNRPARPLATRFGSGGVGQDSTAVFTIPDEWVEETAEYVLRTSSLSSVQMTRNIEYLLRYPYGCLEQTTSALFPLLYFNDLAKVVRPELFGSRGHEYFLAEGIEKVLRFQQDNGAFTYWPNSTRIHNWSSIYASHFLVEARLAGYEVEDSGYQRTIRFLEDVARNKNYSDITTEHRIYACLVLAKVGKLSGKLFNFLSGINTSEVSAYSAYQLASALALAGDVAMARKIVPFDVQPDLTPPEAGGNLSSGVRNDALLLEMMLDVDPNNPSITVLARSLLQQAQVGRWYNTQSTAFALMALGKYFRRNESGVFTGEIVIAVGERHRIDTADFMLVDKELGGRQISLSIDGKGPCYYFWQARGVPTTPEDLEYDRGITVSREYLDESGAPVDLSGIPLGAQLVGHISITSRNRSLENVVIADLLPAAFEIENRRLANTPSMAWLPSTPTPVQYQDIRDDRVLMFVDLPGRKTLEFYYGLRVVAAGDFVVPPIAAECMYNPLIAGAGSSGRVKVIGVER